MEVRPFDDTMLDSLVALLNEAITGRRCAAAVEAEEFRQRVLSHPGFDPAGLLVIPGSDGRLVGAVHAVRPPTHMPRYARLAGQGYIFGPYVRGDARGQGLGRALLAEAESYLSASCETIFIHGLRSPFYHTQEGPRQPYCGSTEVIGLTIDDVALLEFLERAGYRPVKEREVSMVALLRPLNPPARVPEGVTLVRVTAENPWRGPVAWVPDAVAGYGYEQFSPMARYDSLAVTRGATMLGHCQWYPMRWPGRAVLFDLRLDPSLRGLGLGSLLLDGALAAMAEAGYREVELHTSPQRNEIAYMMYRVRGFREVAEWIILEKSLK